MPVIDHLEGLRLSPSPCSLLRDLPNELFYQVLWHSTDISDLSNMAEIPLLNSRMRQFVKVCTGQKDLYHTPQVFHDFPRHALREPAEEYTINLIEIDQSTRISRELFNELYIKQTNVRNFLMILGMVAIKRTDHQSLEWIWPEVTVVEEETVRREFNLRCILVLTEEVFRFENTTFNTACGQVIGKNVKEFTLVNVLVSGFRNMVNGMLPAVLNIDNASTDWIHAIDYPHAEELQINHALPPIKSTAPYCTKEEFSSFAINFQNITFDQLRTLELNNVNCMKYVSFPVLETLKMKITGRTKNGNMLVVPIIQDIDAPLCEALYVEIHQVLPEVKNIKMPQCQTLNIRVVGIRHELPNDPDYYLDWDEYFGLSHSEVYDANSTNDQSAQTRSLPRDLHGWPHASEVTLTDTSHLFRNHDFLSDASKLTMLFVNPEEESHIYIPETHGEMPHLRSLTIIDKMTMTVPKCTDIFCPQYRLNSYNLEHLSVCRSPHSNLYLNYENMSTENFPKLKSLHVQFSNQLDKFPDRSILRPLTSLILEKYELEEVMKILNSLRDSSLETIIIGRTLRRLTNFGCGSSLPQEICHSLTRHFSDSLLTAIVDFDDLLTGQLPEPSIVIEGMRSLKEIGVGGINKLTIQNCPLLTIIQIRVGEEWHIVELPSLQKVDDQTYKLNVLEFVEDIREKGGPLFTPVVSNINSCKRKASTTITGSMPSIRFRSGPFN